MVEDAPELDGEALGVAFVTVVVAEARGLSPSRPD